MPEKRQGSHQKAHRNTSKGAEVGRLKNEGDDRQDDGKTQAHRRSLVHGPRPDPKGIVPNQGEQTDGEEQHAEGDADVTALSLGDQELPVGKFKGVHLVCQS